MDVELILLDWGGTLVSVAGQGEALHAAAREVVRLLGTDSDAAAAELAVTAIATEKAAAADPEHREVNLREFLGRWAGQRSWTADEAMLEQAVAIIGRHWVGGALEVIPGALDAVTELRRRGYRLGLVSNVWLQPAFCRAELERQGFAALLDFAVFSSEVGYRKPAERIYRTALAADRASGGQVAPSRVLFVGDSPSCDVIAPAELGMRTALIASAPGLWPREEHEAAQPDWRLEDIRELPAVLNGQPT